MPRSEKYYAAECDCDYSEVRIVLAKSPADARKKLENGDYDGVVPGNIGSPRMIYKVEPATPDELGATNLYKHKPVKKPKHR